MIRRFGEPVLLGQRYIPRPGAYAVLSLGQSVLLTHQSEPEPEFQLPGGGIDPGESPVAALHREVFEETGWIITKPRRIGAYKRFAYMPEYDMWAEKTCLVFTARPVRRISDPPETAHTAIWMTPEIAATELTSSGDRHMLARAFS